MKNKKHKKHNFKQYMVQLSAVGNLTGSIVVTAESEEEAEISAIAGARNGDVLWRYDGCKDETIEAENVTVTA